MCMFLEFFFEKVGNMLSYDFARDSELGAEFGWLATDPKRDDSACLLKQMRKSLLQRSSPCS